jgi:hypothetical protein
MINNDFVFSYLVFSQIWLNLATDARLPLLLDPAPHRDYYCIGSNFWKFYLIRTGFTLGEAISLVKAFRLFRLKWIVLVLFIVYNFTSIWDQRVH